MATLSTPPRIALGEPMSGSSLLVAQMTSAGSVTGSTVSAAGAAATGGSSAAKAVTCAAARKPAATIAVMSVFMSRSRVYSYFAYCLGSKASRTDSPMNTTSINVTVSAPNGARVSHSLSRFSGKSAWSINSPQLGVGAGKQ